MCSNLLYRHYGGDAPIELSRPVPADTWIGNVICNLLRKIGDPLPSRPQRLIGALILDIQVAIGGRAVPSSTFEQVAPVFGDVDAQCLVNILNRPFQDRRPIFHVDSFKEVNSIPLYTKCVFFSAPDEALTARCVSRSPHKFIRLR